MQRYYYQKGMCKALGYNSLNPVAYVSYGDDMNFVKKEMVCQEIANGKCKQPENCQLLKDAPEMLSNKNHLLSEKRL